VAFALQQAFDRLQYTTHRHLTVEYFVVMTRVCERWNSSYTPRKQSTNSRL